MYTGIQEYDNIARTVPNRIYKEPRWKSESGGWEQQRAAAFDWLVSKGWRASRIDVKRNGRDHQNEESHGLVFAAPHRLQVLLRRGHLTLMDATHDTNRLKWYLFTLMVRDENCAWIPVSHMLLQHQNSDIISEGLKVLQEWCGDRWLCQYFLTDDSAAEQTAVRKAFEDNPSSTTSPQHLLCRVHSERTLLRKLTGKENKEVTSHIIAALKVRQTEGGCIESIQQAIQAAQTEKDRKYIEREWLNTRRKWANYTRMETCQLLQITDTNAVESWHATLKRERKKELSHWTLHGICAHVASIAREWDARADITAHHFRTRHMTPVQNIPNLRRFPYPAQELICTQLQLMFTESFQEDFDRRLAERPPAIEDEVKCTCLFYRRYQLPCAHILKQDQVWGTIPQHQWDMWAYMWTDSGFEMYERARPLSHATEDVHQQIGAPAKQKLEVRETVELLHDAYYRVNEEIDELNVTREQATRIRARWIDSLQHLVGGIRGLAVGELLGEIEQQWKPEEREIGE